LDHRTVQIIFQSLLDELDFTVICISQSTVERIAQIYGRWGKGVHRASLNSGDCFAYDVWLQAAFRGKGFRQDR
jgi:ribonuclease VapC